MAKPTKAKNPQEQFILERKRFEKRMKPKPVLAEQIKRREQKQAKKLEKQKVFVEDII